jgi:TIR domain
MPHVFLSYSRTDRNLARRLIADLQRGGLNVWSDHMLTLGGQWLTDISAAIQGSTALVLLASPGGLASKWVMREVSAAQASGVPVVPMLTGGLRYSDLPPHLAGINGVDLEEDYTEAVGKVTSALRRQHLRTNLLEESSEYNERALLVLTADQDLADNVRAICQAAALVTVHHADEPKSLTHEVRKSHVVVIDDDPRWDISFVAGYTAGSGRWAICIVRNQEIRLYSSVGVAFVEHGSSQLAEEIYAAAFLPLRNWTRGWRGNSETYP